MAPSTYARDKCWFWQPWVVESKDPKHWAYVAPDKPVPGEDGDAEVLGESNVVEDGQSADGVGVEDGGSGDGDNQMVDTDVSVNDETAGR